MRENLVRYKKSKQLKKMESSKAMKEAHTSLRMKIKKLMNDNKYVEDEYVNNILRDELEKIVKCLNIRRNSKKHLIFLRNIFAYPRETLTKAISESMLYDDNKEKIFLSVLKNKDGFIKTSLSYYYNLEHRHEIASLDLYDSVRDTKEITVEKIIRCYDYIDSKDGCSITRQDLEEILDETLEKMEIEKNSHVHLLFLNNILKFEKYSIYRSAKIYNDKSSITGIESHGYFMGIMRNIEEEHFRVG